MKFKMLRLSLCTLTLCLSAQLSWAQEANPNAEPIKKEENLSRTSQSLIGNVGIDVLNPTDKLHVAGNIKSENSFSFFEANGTSGNSGLNFQENGASKAYIWWEAFNDVLRLSAQSGGGGSHVTIIPDGAVGIGTVSDSARLHIQSGSTNLGHALDIDDSSGKNIFTIEDNGNVGINYPNPNAKLTLDGSMNLYNETAFYGQMFSGNGDMFINGKFGIFLFPGPSIPAQDLILQAPSGQISFGFPGNVGIGTNDPLAKLHVSSTMMIGAGAPAAGYALSVNGKIMAEEVRVQLDTNWPDYVFGDSYNLLSLKETARFIDTNNHLPGIPSASEIESSGVPLGEMNRLLLEKIEELTLHVIQLSNEMEILKANQK